MYFDALPNLEYPSLNPESNSLFDLDRVKNFFVRPTINEDIVSNINFYEKYKIVGDERPDNVAQKIYEDSEFDWLILLANNIVDVYNEWPMQDSQFYEYLDKKYKGNNYNNVYYYETTEVKDSKNRIILKEKIRVPSDFSITHPDTFETISPIKSVSYVEYEREKNDSKRNIVLIRKVHTKKVVDELRYLRYQKSSQFVDKKTKKVKYSTI